MEKRRENNVKSPPENNVHITFWLIIVNILIGMVRKLCKQEALHRFSGQAY